MAHRRVAVLLGAPRSRTETVNVMHGKKCVYPMDCLRTTESRGSSKSRFFPRPDGLELWATAGSIPPALLTHACRARLHPPLHDML